MTFSGPKSSKVFASSAKISALIGLVSIVLGLVLGYLGGHGFIPVDAASALVTGLLLGILFFACGAMTLVNANLPLYVSRDGLYKGGTGKEQPREVDRSTLTRVIKDKSSGAEVLISGKAEDTIKSSLENNWPFDPEHMNMEWHVIDSQGNDVTNQPLSAFDGIATIIYEG